MRALGVFLSLLAASALLFASQSLAEVPQPPILLDSGAPSGKPQCSDGIDNDGDGKIDFPTDGRPYTGTGDDGCWDPTDDLEAAGLPAGTPTSSNGECSSRTLSIPGNVYNNCDFGVGDLNVTAQNIIIEKSIIRGEIGSSSKAVANTLIVRDSDIIGPDNTSSITKAAHGNLTLERVRAWKFTWPFYTETATARDSTFYDLCGSGSNHVEMLLTNGSDPMDLRRNWLNLNKSDDCTGGLVSGVIAMYSHETGGWADVHNKTLINNRIQMEDDARSWFHAYLGDWCGDAHTPTGMTFSGNVLVGDNNQGDWPQVTGWAAGGGNVWSGNVRGKADTTTSLNGTAYPEAVSCYW